MNKKYYLYFVGGLLAVTAVTSAFLTNSIFMGNSLNKVNLNSFFLEEQSHNYDLNELISPVNYSKIPDSKTAYYPAANSKSMAILIPQTHKYPGSNSSDASNNSATIAQEQIYEIVSHLQTNYGINLVMVEGDLKGIVPEQKIDDIKNKIQLKEKFSKAVSAIKENDNGKINSSFYTLSQKLIGLIERDVILAGAPLKLMAEGKKLAIFGAEDLPLQNQSAEIVRDSIYLQDRLAQMQNNGINRSATNPGTNITQLRESLVKTLLQKLSKTNFNNNVQKTEGFNASSLKSELTLVKFVSNKDEKLSPLVEEAANIYGEIAEAYNSTKIDTTTMPSRANNPYMTVTDSSKIQGLIKKNNEKLQDIVVDKRNTEAAKYFAELLKSQKQTAGVITFGSYHEEGLIKELNELGISVLTITPNEVTQRSA